MLVRTALSANLEGSDYSLEREAAARLPFSLKRDAVPVRKILHQGLAASRLFAIGDRKGVLSAAQHRSGRSFRLDVRQRVVVKALVSRHAGRGSVRGQALAAHVRYLGRSGAGAEGARPQFFSRDADEVNAAEFVADWGADRHHFRFIVSPEHGDRIADLQDYTREVMRRVGADLGEPELSWVATCHFDTDQPHAHVLVRGRRSNGRDLVMPRDYIGFGFRSRAQEVAQERLGDLSRIDAERRIWRETESNRFTGFDRRLLQSMSDERLVDDGLGGRDAWAALLRGRLRHLEALGLAHRVGRRYRLDAELELKLRTLQLRNDIIRTQQQRRLESGRDVQTIGSERVRGRVVARGAHDELGASTWVILEDRHGRQLYARLAAGEALPQLGRTLEVQGRTGGLATARRGREWSR